MHACAQQPPQTGIEYSRHKQIDACVSNLIIQAFRLLYPSSTAFSAVRSRACCCSAAERGARLHVHIRRQAQWSGMQKCWPEEHEGCAPGEHKTHLHAMYLQASAPASAKAWCAMLAWLMCSLACTLHVVQHLKLTSSARVDSSAPRALGMPTTRFLIVCNQGMQQAAHQPGGTLAAMQLLMLLSTCDSNSKGRTTE